jgi:Bacterial Ig domain
MKKIFWILFLIGGYSGGQLQAQTVSFNFSLASQSVSGWINVHGDPSTGVRTATDGTTGISLSSIAMANWVPLSGTGSAYDGLGQTGGTFFPSGVMLNHWFQFGTLAVYNGAVPQLLISGLNKDSLYTVKMTGSSTSSYNSNPTQYTISGSTVYGYININSHNNTATGASFNNIQPDTSGKIRVYVNTVGTDVADICGIQITKGRTTPPPVVSITNPVNHAVLAEDGNFGITATASESGGTIVKVQFFIDTTKIGESTTSPYSATWINPDAGNYIITATAVDNSGVSNSSSINVNIEPLSSFWSMTGNIKANADSNFLGTVDTNRLAIRTNNIERVSVMGDGTVGIGTKTTYGYKLAVNGMAIFTKVKVKTAGTWPDYVFEKGYNLPSLEEIEQYVMIHKHLPGIMAAAEADKKGLDVGDNQAALLKKIEELTLYLIKQNKKLEQQQREIDELKKLIEAKK